MIGQQETLVFLAPLFCKLKDGRKMVVFSDQPDTAKMPVFRVAAVEEFDAAWQSFETVRYSDIERTVRNRTAAYG